MGRETLKIVFSLLGAGAVALGAFVLLEAILTHSYGRQPLPGGVMLFRFQIGAMLAMALFAGVAIVIYARLSRSLAARGSRRPRQASLRKWR